MNLLNTLLGIELSAVSYREKLVSTAGGLISIWFLILMNERVFHLFARSMTRSPKVDS
ncbi:MAG: hypothetical protein WCJ66_10290 [Verrucomicrobiota bacterium]